MTFVDTLLESLEDLGQRDQTIARYFIDHVEELPFLSAGEIAKNLEVNGAAITRFSQRVGFEGYPHLQRAIRHELRATLGVRQPGAQDTVVANFWTSERSNLETLLGIPEDQILAFTNAIAEAQYIWILGARASYGLSLIAESLLSSFRPKVQAYSTDLLCSRPEQLLELTDTDAVLVYTIRRYSRATTRVILALRQRGVKVLLLTDQGASPLTKIADQCLRLPTQGTEVLASMASFISVTTLIASLVATKLRGSHLQQAEQLKAEFSVYEY
jgi:DNA-binding MurR/RpiR family transcriptional regulator